MIVQYKLIYEDEDFTWRSQLILAETSKYKSKECSGNKVKLFRSLCTYVYIFRYSSKKIRVSGGGPGACLQNMEGKLPCNIWGGGQGRSKDGFELWPPPNAMPR